MEKMRGDRPKRSKSPSTRKNQRKNVPARRMDPGTEDFVRFVREYQVNRQPTFTGLPRRAPLPEIGQSINIGLNDSGFLDRLNDDYEEDFLVDEIVYANKVSDPKKDKIIKEMLTITRQQTKDNLYTTGPSMITNDSFTLSRRKGNLHKSLSLPSQTNRQIKCSKKNRQSLKQLPPLYQEELPTRPTAPSPSRTPPINGSDGSSEDQVEFLDLS